MKSQMSLWLRVVEWQLSIEHLVVSNDLLPHELTAQGLGTDVANMNETKIDSFSF